MYFWGDCYKKQNKNELGNTKKSCPVAAFLVEQEALIHPFRPGDDLVHRFQKLFPLCDPFPSAIFLIGEAELAHVVLLMEILLESIQHLGLLCYTDLFWDSLIDTNRFESLSPE